MEDLEEWKYESCFLDMHFVAFNKQARQECLDLRDKKNTYKDKAFILDLINEMITGLEQRCGSLRAEESPHCQYEKIAFKDDNPARCSFLNSACQDEKKKLIEFRQKVLDKKKLSKGDVTSTLYWYYLSYKGYRYFSDMWFQEPELQFSEYMIEYIGLICPHFKHIIDDLDYLPSQGPIHREPVGYEKEDLWKFLSPKDAKIFYDSFKTNDIIENHEGLKLQKEYFLDMMKASIDGEADIFIYFLF